MHKNTTFVATIGLISILFWVWLKPWIAAPTRFSDASVWLKPLLLFTILIAVVGLAFMLIKQLYVKLLCSAVVGLPFLVIFGFSELTLAAFAIMVLLQLRSIQNLGQEVSQRMRISVQKTMQRGLPFLITSILILVSFAYYLNPRVQARAISNELPPTFGQAIEKTVDNFLGGNIRSLSPQAQSAVKNQVVKEALDQLTVMFQPYLQYLPPIMAFGLFLVLQGLSFLFIWISILFAYLFFILLQKVGWVKISLVQKETQELEF